MHINLPTEMEKFVQTKVDAGFYSNASEVIRDAIRRMREGDEKVAALRAALKAGDAQLDQGEGTPYTPELLEHITKQAKSNAHRNKNINPGVVP